MSRVFAGQSILGVRCLISPLSNYDDIVAQIEFTADEFDLVREMLKACDEDPNNLGFSITLDSLKEKFGAD